MTHWTDRHIVKHEDRYVAYDEAGLEHSTHKTHDEARDALVVYEAMYLSENEASYVASRAVLDYVHNLTTQADYDGVGVLSLKAIAEHAEDYTSHLRVGIKPHPIGGMK